MNKLLFVLLPLIPKLILAQTANEILQKSAKAYENTKMYIDSGKVLQEFYEMEHPFDSAKQFKTAYSKSGLFNFEYYEVGKSNSLYIINKGADAKVQSWWGITNHLETNMSLDSQLSAAKGVSSLTSTLITELLFPKNKILGEPILSSIKDAKNDGIDDVNGLRCYKISGNEVPEGKISLWISKTDFLIRKLLIDKKVQKFRVKSTYDIYPTIPKTINKKVFEFKPNRKIKL